MTSDLRIYVRWRAGDQCEYCRAKPEDDPHLSFHIEHIIARQHGGTDHEVNLALACHWCNAHKGPNLTGIDSETQQIVELFNPRKHSWPDHFRLEGPKIIGITPTGRTTAQVLPMNRKDRVAIRRASTRSSE